MPMNQQQRRAADRAAKRQGHGAPPPPHDVPLLAIYGPDAPWSADDRAWFAANPRRTHRVRRPHPGEAEALGADTSAPGGAVLVVVVRQEVPGLRHRRPALLPAAVLAEPVGEVAARQHDEALSVVFDLAHRPGFTVSDVRAELGRRLAASGGGLH
jgi:hypothetical protein